MSAPAESEGDTATAAQGGVAATLRRPGKTARFVAVLVAVALVILSVAGIVAERQTPVGAPFAVRPSGTSNGEWWRAPLETNAFNRQTGYRINSDLDAVHFHADGQRGWAVGDRGVIVATADGGKTWQAQSSNTQEWLRSVTFPADDLRGWAVGGRGVIVATADGGKTWQAQASNTKAMLTSVAFLADGRRGWAVGDDGTIVATADGGKIWQAQASNTKAWLSSIVFLVDGQQGWAVGLDGVIVATADGGKIWQTRASSTKERLDSVTFLADGQRGWAVGTNGTIVSTADSGNTWQTQASNTKKELQSVAFLADGQRGWVVGNGGVIVTTADGGNTWQEKALNTRAALRSLAFLADGQRGWAVGEHGAIVATVDGGKTWQIRASNPKAWFYSVAFLADGQQGWAVGDKGAIVATMDGGKTWQVQESNTTELLTSVAFLADGQRGWAVGDLGSIVATADGGKTWQMQPQSSNTQERLNSVAFLADGQRGWAVGDSGVIVSTADGGKTRQAQASNTKAWLSSISFIADGQRGWAVGDNGTIVTTADGGKTWQAQASNTKEWLMSVAFLADGRRGWAVGDHGAIVATADGGNTWKAQASNTTKLLMSVAFVEDGQRGWAVGNNGTMVSTTDGGKTWQAQASNTKEWLMSVTFLPDGRRGWAVGDGGAIVSTADGGKTWRQSAEYRRWPAPWFWALLIFVSTGTLGLASWRVRRNRPIDLQNRILTEAVEDGPVTDAARDRLGFGPIVDAMANFMRHESTRPPVTFAVTAPWGRGKSSLMHLLEKRLQAQGVDTVWFNAWHHQREPVMLSALLDAITKQAIPFWLTPSGIAFRSGLLWKRFLRRPFFGLGPLLMGCLVVLVVVTTISSLVQTLLSSHGPGYVDPITAAWAQIFHAVIQSALVNEASDKLFAGDWTGFLKNSLGAVGSNPAALFVLAAWAYGAVSLWFLVFHFLRPFPASPAALLASLGDKFNIRQAEEQTGFRQRFREHFADVCEVLQPYTLTIFIDDLDRCDAAKAAEMLEAANYLSDAGKCFLVLGMAKGIVEAQLGDAYKDIAERHAAFASLDRAISDAANGNGERARTEADRRDYARNYLRKLIQIEVPVPKFSTAELNALLAEEAEQDANAHVWDARWSAGLRQGRRIGRVVGYALLLALLGVVFFHGYRWSEQAGAKATEQANRSAEQRLLHVEERRRAALQAGAYRSWLRESQSADGRAAKTADATASGRRAAHLEDVDGRWRRLEANLDDLDRHARALAEKEFKRADEAVARGLAAFDQLAAADKWQQAAELKPKPVASAGNASEPDLLQRSARDDGPLVVPPDPDAAPSWPYLLYLLTIVVPGTWLIRRSRDRYRIKESDDYKQALAAWQPVLLVRDHMRAPREAKRFLNLSRYLTLRINAAEYEKRSWIKDWLGRVLCNIEPPIAGKAIDEATIVGMTALHLAHGHSAGSSPDFRTCLVASKRSLAEWAEEDTVVMNAVIEARSRLSGKGNPTEAEVELFLRVIGELKS